MQNDGALIFAKDFNDKKYFTSIARNDDGEWIIRSNAPKSENGLNNKIKNGGKELFNRQVGAQINANATYDDTANSSIKLDSETIPQNEPKGKGISEAEIDEFIKSGERSQTIENSLYPRESARLILQQNKDDGINFYGFEIKGQDYDSLIETMNFKTKKAEKEFEKLMRSYYSNDDFVKYETQIKYKTNEEAF